MTEDETRARIEAHIDRGNALLAFIDEHLERGISDTSSEHLARGAELEARIEEHLARWEQMFAEFDADDAWRFTTRLERLRNERILGEIAQTLVQRTHEMVRYFADEGRAHRDALWRISDKLERERELATAR